MYIIVILLICLKPTRVLSARLTFLNTLLAGANLNLLTIF